MNHVPIIYEIIGVAIQCNENPDMNYKPILGTMWHCQQVATQEDTSRPDGRKWVQQMGPERERANQCPNDQPWANRRGGPRPPSRTQPKCSPSPALAVLPCRALGVLVGPTLTAHGQPTYDLLLITIHFLARSWHCQQVTTHEDTSRPDGHKDQVGPWAQREKGQTSAPTTNHGPNPGEAQGHQQGPNRNVRHPLL